MKKEEIIKIVEAMKFRLDLDMFDVEEKEWMRFQLHEDLDERTLRWIWYKNNTDAQNFEIGAKILFNAGQKAKMQQLSSYISL